MLNFTETGSGTYNIDNVVEITATPNVGYKFIRWELTQADFSGIDRALSIDDYLSANTKIKMGASDATARAVYEPIDYTVNVADGSNGSAVSSRAAFPNNIFQEMVITATPETGWEFDRWDVSGPGSLSSRTSNPSTFTVGAGDAVITPIYKKIVYSLRVDGNGDEIILNVNGAPVNSSTVLLNYKDSVTIKARPPSGSFFVNWSLSEPVFSFPDNTLAETVLSMGAPGTTTANARETVVTANYQRSPRTITIVSGGNGSVGGSSGTYYLGDTINISASPAVNYGFSNWSWTALGDVNNPNSSIAVFTVGDSDSTVTANFIFTGRQQNIVGTTGYQAFTELEFRWTHSALDGQPFPNDTATTYTYEISTSNTFPTLAAPAVSSTTFLSSVIFKDLTPYTRYYARCVATGNAITGTAVIGTSNIVEFVSNPCGGYTAAKDANGNLVITGAGPNTGVTISESTGSLETRGLVRPIADDQFGNLFIAEGSGKVRTQTSSPGGRLVFDGGFPKFYNDTWSTYSAGINNGSVSIYDPSIPAQYPYFYNAINHVEREDNSRKRLLYINDAASGNYTAKVFNNTVYDIARVAGFTPSSIGSESAGTHSGFLQTLHSTRAAWRTYFNGYDVIVWLGTHYQGSAYLNNNMIQGLLDYFDDGGGLFVITDHNVFQLCVNQILPYYGVNFTGNINRTPSNNAYKISNILANSNYIPTGYHPLFANINTNGSIAAGGSEGMIVYGGTANTSQYTTDANGNLTISSHNNGAPLGSGTTFVRTASDCGGSL